MKLLEGDITEVVTVKRKFLTVKNCKGNTYWEAGNKITVHKYKHTLSHTHIYIYVYIYIYIHMRVRVCVGLCMCVYIGDATVTGFTINYNKISDD